MLSNKAHIPYRQLEAESEEKLSSKSEIKARLRELEINIDKMINDTLSLLPDCCEVDVITNEKELAANTFSNAKYMKFLLIYRSGCLQD